MAEGSLIKASWRYLVVIPCSLHKIVIFIAQTELKKQP